MLRYFSRIWLLAVLPLDLQRALGVLDLAVDVLVRSPRPARRRWWPRRADLLDVLLGQRGRALGVAAEVFTRARIRPRRSTPWWE